MVLKYAYKAIKILFYEISFKWSRLITIIKFKCNGVTFKYDFKAKGIPIVSVSLNGTFRIGSKFQFNSGKYYNMIGRQQPCYFIVSKHGVLNIGNNVGLSCAAIVCWNNISIGDNVRIGGGVVIYDTDFHSLDFRARILENDKISTIKTSPVIINDGVFIGAHSIILKGVVIGKNSIVGAGSVVAKSIPENEIWGGSPAQFIRKIVATL